MLDAPILAHYDPNWETKVETDASDGTVAGVLSQKSTGDQWHPVGFFSKTMAPAECNYPIHDKEMLAIIRSLEEWRAELEGLQRPTRFDILTDHRALEYFMSTKKLLARQARWMEFLSRYHFLIRYCPGKQNMLADALSRRQEDTDCQNQIKDETRSQAMLKPDCLDPSILEEMQKPVIVAALEERKFATSEGRKSLDLIDRILQANRASKACNKYRKEAAHESGGWSAANGLLRYRGRLLVPER